MMNEKAVERVDATESTSFGLDLKQWLNIMRAYENGGHAYYATMPTDSLVQFRDTIKEAENIGLSRLKDAQFELGKKVRAVFDSRDIISVTTQDYQAPGVIVVYTDRDDMHKGSAFTAQGLQVAAGVPLKIGESDSFKTFRVGLFGLDKLSDIDGTVSRFEAALDAVLKG